VSSCPVTTTGLNSVAELFRGPCSGLAAVVEESGVGEGACAAAVKGSHAQPRMLSESTTNKTWCGAKNIWNRRDGCIATYKSIAIIIARRLQIYPASINLVRELRGRQKRRAILAMGSHKALAKAGQTPKLNRRQLPTWNSGFFRSSVLPRAPCWRCREVS
jgi:hypothetical protein